MKNLIKILSITIFVIISVSCNSLGDKILKAIIPERNDIAEEAEFYCKADGFNEDFCILIDMSIHSGKKRFFVYNFKTMEIEKSYLVSHGCGDSLWSGDLTKTNPTFSNINNSHSSSLGKYRIGERGWSSYGVNINYRIHGLESTNSNAAARDIVFHSWDPVSDEEVYPKGTPEGWGCPAVSNNAFLEIDLLLKRSKKPVLMWIYK
jgi:hypothetical protein